MLGGGDGVGVRYTIQSLCKGTGFLSSVLLYKTETAGAHAKLAHLPSTMSAKSQAGWLHQTYLVA